MNRLVTNTSALPGLLRLCLFALLFAMVWAPPASGAACVATLDLSTILGTTCDIGSLEYKFESGSNSHDYLQTPTSGTTNYGPFAAKDFSFTPVANGFTIAYTLGSITAATPGPGFLYQADFGINYVVTGLGGASFTDVGISCGTLAVAGGTGSNADAYCQDSFLTNHDFEVLQPYNRADLSGGVQINSSLSPVPCSNASPNPPDNCSRGLGDLTVFNLTARNGALASYDPSTTVTYDSTAPAVPEPSSFLLLGPGLAAMLGMVRRKRLG